MKGKRLTRGGSDTAPVAVTRQVGFRAVCVGMFAALIVATPLLPTETVHLGGSAAATLLFWLVLLFLWVLIRGGADALVIRGGPSLWCFALFVAWHSLAALVMAWQGHPRASMNMLWQWIGFLIAFFLARQMLRSGKERRAVIALMMSLAVALSMLGYYQYLHEHPITRSLYEENPDKVLREAGIDSPAGSAARAVFENRLYSTEPFATFALANTLAGFLSAWLITAVGIGIVSGAQMAHRARLAAVVMLTALLIAGCWLLTKSRTAWLATFLGMALLVIYGRRTGWRPDWRILSAAIAAVVLLPIAAFVIGGLDTLVILEASKALLYRVQYWRSTAAMIADYPVFGCGPGNFQQYYTAYKLPEASETIAEPHNFLFEIWGTAGTPGILLFLVFLGSLPFQVWRNRKPNDDAVPDREAEGFGHVRAVYWGGLAGVLVAYVMCTFLEGYSLSAGLFVLGLPIAALLLLGWHPWVVEGRWSIVVPSIGITVLLVNFLAAGGISFSGVASTLWLLAAVMLNETERPGQGRAVSRRAVWVGAAMSIALLGLFVHTTYLPQLESAALIAEGDLRHVQGDGMAALTNYRKAAEADRYSPDGWQRLANLAHQAWLATSDREYYEMFVHASDQSLQRNRRYHVAEMQVGHWWLGAFRKFEKRELIDRAIEHYEIATRLYPNYNLGQAQLAWAYHLAGRDAEAADRAAEALRLDSLSAHREQKLAAQMVYDPRTDSAKPAKGGGPTAEQRMHELRKSRE